MKWIKLHYPSGEPVLINSDIIEQINVNKEGSKVFYARLDRYGNDEFFDVQESFEKIEAMLIPTLD